MKPLTAEEILCKVHKIVSRPIDSSDMVDELEDLLSTPVKASDMTRFEMLITHWLLEAGEAQRMTKNPCELSSYDLGWNEAMAHAKTLCAGQLRAELDADIEDSLSTIFEELYPPANDN